MNLPTKQMRIGIMTTTVYDWINRILKDTFSNAMMRIRFPFFASRSTLRLDRDEVIHIEKGGLRPHDHAGRIETSVI